MDSNAVEFSTPISSMPSFAFFSLGPVIEGGCCALDFSSDISMVNATRDTQVSCFRVKKRDEIYSFPDVSDDNWELPSSIDWREMGAVTPIKSQGSCGSCYAFGAKDSLEGLFKIQTNSLVCLSPQHIVDCDCGKFGRNYGCEGGQVSDVFEFVKWNGIAPECLYKYKGWVKDGSCPHGQCHHDRMPVIKIDGYVMVEDDEDALARAVCKQPVAVSVDSKDLHFKYYPGGKIATQSRKVTKKLNHVVCIVGYDIDPHSGRRYWIVKNSWGCGWGEKGYMRVWSDPNKCFGMTREAMYPIKNYWKDRELKLLKKLENRIKR